MKTIETSITVMDDGTFHIQGTATLLPGKYLALLVIEEHMTPSLKRSSLRFSDYPFGLISQDVTFRREELYYDDEC